MALYCILQHTVFAMYIEERIQNNQEWEHLKRNTYDRNHFPSALVIEALRHHVQPSEHDLAEGTPHD